MDRADDGLTTTDYAVLGLLAVQPWSAYELTKQVDRGLRWFWPRSGNKLYESPKRLAERGLARARTATTGRRRRSVYSITAAGRRVLRAWLDRSPAPPTIEHEGLVHVLFSDQGSRGQLVRTLEHIHGQALEMQAFGAALGREFVASAGGPFPERLHVNALIFEYMWRHVEAIRTWAEWALDEVDKWDGAGHQPARASALLRRYAELAAAMEDRPAQ